MSINRQTLQEQNGHAGAIPKRASAASPYPQNSRHRTASTYGVHDESAPYITRDRHTQPPIADDYSSYDVSRQPSSTRRYKPTQAVTKVTEEVPTRGRNLTVRGLLLAIGLVLLAGMLLAFLFTAYLAPALQNYTYTQQYGNPPRIFKTEAITGHGTKTNPVNRYIGINNGGVVEVIEIPTGTPTADTQPHLYVIGRLTGTEAANVPITNISFADLNGDGKVDMEVTVNDTLYVLYNDGKEFKLQ